MKHYTISFFILHEGCPNQCIFCNQNRITGRSKVRPVDVSKKIESYLGTMDLDVSKVEVGFFGGSFTALDRKYQDSLLEPVQEYVAKKQISGIRLSTRPDYINEDILLYLKKKHVSCIELGVQSFSNSVLETCKRGHTAEDVVKASRSILERDMILGHQMMVGLPGSLEKDEYRTALKVKEAGAVEVRIYPVLVISGTELADLWASGKYEPLDQSEAVERCAKLMLFFEVNGIKVIRCGLHPSENLLSGQGYSAGPFHPAFGEQVRTRMFSFYLEFVRSEFDDIERLEYNSKDRGALIGFEGGNKALIDSLTDNLNENNKVSRGDLLIYSTGKKVLLDKKHVARDILPDILKE